MAYKTHSERRQRCATCGQPDVMHTAIGLPFSRHARGKRHREALAAPVAPGARSPTPMICENCGKDEPNCSRFRDDKTGREWASVCGGCKIRITLADPIRKAQLEADMKRMATGLLLGTKGGEA